MAISGSRLCYARDTLETNNLKKENKQQNGQNNKAPKERRNERTNELANEQTMERMEREREHLN